LDPWTRYAGELGALAGAALYMQLPILVGAAVAGAALHTLAGALPAILTADLHLAGISLLLLIPSLSSPLRVSLFLAAAWLVPALAPESLARASSWLDAAAALRTANEGVALRVLAAPAALCLTACLLRTRPTRSAS